jgi:hypothetical protein
MRVTLRTLATVATLVTVALGSSACGSKPKTEVLGVQYQRTVGTSATSVAPVVADPTTTLAPAAAPAPVAAAHTATTAAPKAVAKAVAVAPGSVAGTFTSAGTPVAGVAVVAKAAGVARQTTTAADGSYRIDGLAPGSYEVRANDPGDDSSVCGSDGGCLTKRPPSEQVSQVTVSSGAVSTVNFA